MLRGAFKTFTAGSTIVVALAASAQLAHAQPDLVIERSDSEMEFVSCEQSQPLVKGRIVIRNEGDSDANLRKAGNLFRSFLAVYNPENIDLIKKAKKRTKMEPREQRAISIEVGAGKVKVGRNYNAFPKSSGSGSHGSHDGHYNDDRKKLSKSQVKEIQEFLESRGYNVGGADGAWGGKTTRAVKSFQKNTGISPAKGQWDSKTAKAIAKFTGGGSSSPAASNIKDSQGRTKITVFAVVDPYNLIDESNESNNIVAYTGWLKCD